MSVRSEVMALLDPILGGRVYADDRPEGEELPHAVVLDGISQAPALSGDARTMAWSHIVQVDLWEDAEVADQDSRDVVVNALDGAALNGSFTLKVQAADRVYDPEFHLAHTAITLRTVRRRAGT